MIVPYYLGNETTPPSEPCAIEATFADESPENYLADPGLAAAVNVALILGKPLLLTGEPGTGKTRLAGHVAMALGLDEPERFDTRSTSLAAELFYQFDSLGRFHSAHAQEKGKRALDFITFGPLGLAILRSLRPDAALFQALALDYPSARRAGAAPITYPCRSVVLIDEIDKAPRDFPNDLLEAIAQRRFQIRELEREANDRLRQATGTVQITADRALQPVVIITSNSEKNLPAPFLRRCVYYHVPFPTPEQLRAIVARRAGAAGLLARLAKEELQQRRELKKDETAPLLNSAVEFFMQLRDRQPSKKPSTAELIDWVNYLGRCGLNAQQTLTDAKAIVVRSLGILAKSEDDLGLARQLAHERLQA
ncbi:MoxR family ATPase [Variovorax sp. J22R115]|uniref:AAA family ATPase n=1 Tax=Variovorax sp. J22R115 TaxID=3053509 RepID=UPI00257805C5|nr:MoxR family ATPase [Variovorax sp. J22R115]MDM0053550.1 MoxR family ATPase [Variovorax sp. J22R115]